MFASLVLLMAAAKKPIKTGASSRHITNLKQSTLESFNIYDTHKESLGEINYQHGIDT
jgi:hypothetical protein